MVSLETIFAAAMQNEEAGLKLKQALSKEIVVANRHHREIGQFLDHFLDEYGHLPEEGDYEDHAQQLPEKSRRSFLRAVSRLLYKDLNRTPEHVADVALERLWKVGAENAGSIIEGMSEEELTIEVLRELTDEVESIRPVSISDMLDLSNVEEAVQAPTREQGVTTGIPNLDATLGGWQEGELVYVVADTGIGKSIAMINHALSAVEDGADVLHISFEVSREKNAQRFNRRVLHMDRGEYAEDIEWAREEMREFWAWTRGSYRIIRRPSKEMTPEQLHNQIRLYKRHEGPIDLLILDYMELMAPSPEDTHLKPHEQLGRMAQKVRNVGQEYNFPVLSPHQAVRPREGQSTHEELHLSKSSKSYDMIRAGDIVIGFVRSPRMQKNRQGLYQILKVRDGPGLGMKIPLYVNLDIMTIAGLDDPDTVEIMEVHEDQPHRGFVGAEEDGDET